jgi:hypothetical protein
MQMLKPWQKYVNSGKPLSAVFPDIRSQFPDLLNQYVWNGCVDWATIADFIRVRVLEGYPVEKYSRLSTFWAARKIYGDQIGDPTFVNKNQGTFESNGLEALIDYGPMLEQDDPEDAETDPTKYNWIEEYQLQPPDKWIASEKLKWEQVYQIDTTNPDQKLSDTLDALAQGNAVLTSMYVFDSIFNVGSNGIVPDPPDGTQLKEAHEVNMVDPDMTTERLWFKNSWGKGWGQNGDGSISFDYFKKYAFDLFVIVPLKTQPAPAPQPIPQPVKQYPSDIVNTQWQPSAEWTLDNKVMFQYANSLFQPDQPISRGQFAASLMNLYKLFKN